MSMVLPSPQKRTFLQGLGDLLRNPQFMGGLQNLAVGMTEHPDPGFHARQGLLIGRNVAEQEDREFARQQYLEQKQAEARRQAFLDQMFAPPTQTAQRASGVDPTYRPPGMAPAINPMEGMNPSQEAYVRQLSQVDPAAALRLVTQHQFQGPQQRKIIKGADGFNYYADTGQRVLPNVTIQPKETERDRKIKGLVGRGIPKDKASDIVDGRLKAITDPVTGVTKYYNLATGAVETPGGQTAEISKAERARLMDEKTRVNTTLSQLDRLEEFIDAGVGLVPAAKDVATGLIGQIPPEARTIPGVGEVGTFPEASKARTNMKLMAEAVIQGLSKNPKVPVYEMQRLKGLLDLESLTTSPEQARQNIAAVRDYLTSLEETAEAMRPAAPSSVDFGAMSKSDLLNYDIDQLTPGQFEAFDRALSQYE